MADTAYKALEEGQGTWPLPQIRKTPEGLTSEEAERRLQIYGRNEVPEESEPLWKMFVKQFLGTMPFMIEVAAALSALIGNWADFCIIMALLLTNGIIGFFEEKNAQASVSALKDGLKRKLPVKRDGVFVVKDVAEFVPGDVLFLRGGNVIPADALWIEGDELAVDQAALTGESLPVTVPREDEPGSEKDSGKKMWSGAIIKQGECRCVVVATGLSTMMGEAAKSIQESSGRPTGYFEGKIISAARVLIMITLVVVGMLFYHELAIMGKPLSEVLEMSLSLVIASVPVALPMVMKVTLSVGAKELAEESAIVTHLTALEEIASMRVLCSDKTGTLTTASMTVYPEKSKCFNNFTTEQVVTFAALASNAANKDDPIDVAVFKAYAQICGEESVDKVAGKLKAKWMTNKYTGFNPLVKRTVAQVTDTSTGVSYQVAKGIVTKILKTDPDDGGIQWTVAEHDSVLPLVKEADEGFSVLGYKTIAVAVSVAGGPMVYAGTLPIMDPPREDTKATIEKIKTANVGVKMITGDHLNIAKELARQIHLGTDIEPNGHLWPASAARDELILQADGFAQVMPKDKHEVVSVMQQHGLVVGMTGDGVNDAPALARAQIGIAVSGATDAAQSAADIVLTKPGLSPIYTAILVSRRIFKRLKSYVIYRICVTVQVVGFLSIISFAFQDAFRPLYIILLALFHDLQIVTIAYDHQVAGYKPETPTVKSLLIVSYSMGLTMLLQTMIMYMHGGFFLSERFSSDFEYKESTMFMQISNASAILIFSARTVGFFWSSVPAGALFASTAMGQVVVNLALLCSGGSIVAQLSPVDIALVWAYNLAWLIILDLAKMLVLRVMPDDPLSEAAMMVVAANARLQMKMSRRTSNALEARTPAQVNSFRRSLSYRASNVNNKEMVRG